MRQGNDRGTQYRSGIYVFDDAQKALAQASKTAFQQCLDKAGYGAITTEILPAPVFYYAEDYHQQYLAKTPAVTAGWVEPASAARWVSPVKPAALYSVSSSSKSNSSGSWASSCSIRLIAMVTKSGR